MYEIKLYYAEVIDNDDQNHDDGEKKGRIQIRTLPEMNGIKEDYLPWVRPFFTIGMSSESFSYNSPEIGDKVWVAFIDKYWKIGYYFTGSFIDGFFDTSITDDILSNVSESIDTTYPNLKFYLIKDQSLFFFNTDTGDKGFINNNGWYFIIDTDGKSYLYFVDQEMKIYNDNTELYIEDDGKITLTTNNDMQINTDTATVDIKNNGDIQISNDGVTFDLKNDGTYKIDGNGTVECKSSGQVDVNGNLTVDV